MKKIFLGLSLLLSMVSCSDFFEMESDHVIYAEEEHLHKANDTIYSVVGILNKLQAIGDRTILLGEARGDLMDVTETTAADLRSVAMFSVNDSNMYNVPRDYYAVINNCNYYIAKADTALKNNRNEYLFRSEYAAVKAIRAWTYLQLVTTYGRVPFVTEPILTKEQAERDYPMAGIQEVCDYFLHEDGLQAMTEIEYPKYGKIKGLDSRLFYMPMWIVLGDLNLWGGYYLDAAHCYYKYITTRNGTNSVYPIGRNTIYWSSSSWTGVKTSRISDFWDETNSAQSEIIAVIPGDSIPSEGYYSTLRGIFNTSSDNDYKVSLVPSQSIIDLSEAQKYCLFENNQFLYAPTGLSQHRTGDLRLFESWEVLEDRVNSKGERYDDQTIAKYMTRNIHIYRRTLVYLRMAEALNCAGYPRFAYQILASGVNNQILSNYVLPYYTDDADILTEFDFPTSWYPVLDPTNEYSTSQANTIGIHARGSGYPVANEYYQMPENPAITDSLEQIAWQQKEVENMIVDEEALEFAFEGYRFYDLVRVALRRNDPAYLADRIYARRGADKKDEVKSAIAADLYNPDNWFLKWNGQIGL